VKEILRSTIHIVARITSHIISLRLFALAVRFRNRVFWQALKRRFNWVGDASFIEYPVVTMGEKYITIGNNFIAYARLRIEAYDFHLGNAYHPRIIIGNNVSLNYDCHIACINQIVIGDNVLIGSKVHITDHSHGSISHEALATQPARRTLVSKGPVIVEDNVWIGEGVVVLPGVRIGQNSIIGANAVVTKDIPPNCVAGGVPARVIRRLDF
jgi:acetyltransferase-like isoleucine patch superfamily enzyme